MMRIHADIFQKEQETKLYRLLEMPKKKYNLDNMIPIEDSVKE